jgi:hypothetical protein
MVTGVEEKVMTKQEVADHLKISKRQVEVLTSRGRIAKPHYLGTASPRWFWSELMESLRFNELVVQPQG